jgi:lactate permease
MLYLLWSLPALAVFVAIGSGRINTTNAASIALLIAIPIALLTGPAAFGGALLAEALPRGLWIGATIVPYILGGLLFWQVAARGTDTSSSSVGTNAISARQAGAPGSIAGRRLLFFGCFLVGPFAEAATGFGVGMLGTVALLRGLGLAPRHLMIFALLSQTMIPWGGMGSGTLLAAAYARMPASELALYSMVPVTLLMLVWLPLFWRTARRAGFGWSSTECAREVGWIMASLALLGPATAWLRPEAAMLAAYGPLIVIRYLVDWRPDARSARKAARQVLPYALLIGGLIITRLLPALREPLGAIWRLAPYEDLPALPPFFHAGTWLFFGAILTALLRSQGRLLGSEARSAWATGKHAVLTIFLFAMMAEILSRSGISAAFAEGVFAALNEGAVLVTPLVSGAFGILANSGSPPNSLFMPSQIALAIQAGLSVAAVAALQHVSGTSMSLFSPVRMSIAAGLANGRGQERAVYGELLWFVVAGFALLFVMALFVINFG